jgi:DNA-binding NarL/FixJ family response regulator
VGDQKVRVLIADDDPLARAVLRRTLSGEGTIVVAEASSASDAVELASRHVPDIVVMDAGLNQDGGSPTPLHLLGRIPGVRVLIMANKIDRDLALHNLRSGASGYLTKEVDMSVLPKVLRAVANGEAAIPRTLTMDLIDRLRALPETEVGTRPVKSVLTPREWEVLDLMCVGRSTTSIATELFVTKETVRSHIKNILRKSGSRSRAEAVDAARSLRRSDRPGRPAAQRRARQPAGTRSFLGAL